MFAMRERPWGVAARNGEVVRYIPLRDQDRMGHCDWLPKAGDLCVCVGHSGDCFHSYVALRQTDGGGWRVVGEFGAYGFGAKLAVLGKREFHLAQAGEEIVMPELADGDAEFWKELALEFCKALPKLAPGGSAAAEASLEVLAPHGSRTAGSWEASARRWAKALSEGAASIRESDFEQMDSGEADAAGQLRETKKRADALAAESST